MTKNFAGLTDYELAIFESIAYAPGNHKGKTVDKLVSLGLVTRTDSLTVRVLPTIEGEWQQWNATHPSDLDVDEHGRPYGAGVKVWK